VRFQLDAPLLAHERPVAVSKHPVILRSFFSYLKWVEASSERLPAILLAAQLGHTDLFLQENATTSS
jgi:hypothetical protein